MREYNISISLPLSLYPYLSPSLSPSLFTNLPISLSLYISLSRPYLYLYPSFAFSLSLPLSLSPSLPLSLSPSLPLSLSPSLCLSLSRCLSVSVSLYKPYPLPSIHITIMFLFGCSALICHNLSSAWHPVVRLQSVVSHHLFTILPISSYRQQVSVGTRTRRQ